MEGLPTDQQQTELGMLHKLGYSKERWEGEDKDIMVKALDKGYTQLEFEYRPLEAGEHSLPAGYTWDTGTISHTLVGPHSLF